MKSVREWLDSLDLGQHANAFEANEVDRDVLGHLDHDLLKEMGVAAVGQRLRILKAIETLNDQSPQTNSLPADLADKAGSSTGEAERRQLTILFADLVGSTELSQQLDPEDLREVNRAYQDAVTAAVERFEGFVARYMGDGVLAYFGYPQAHEEDAERAARAGLALVSATSHIDASVPLEVRVGIATGPVVVGDLIGEGAAQESAVVGETPNLASRLQGLARPGQVVVAKATRALLGAHVKVSALEPEHIKGFSEPVTAYEVRGVGNAAERFESASQYVGPLSGREEELALLRKRWEQANAGTGQVVLLCGEPGVGKSRIVQGLREHIAGEQHNDILYFCSPYHVQSALYPVTEQLRRALGFERDEGEPAKREKLRQTLDGLGLAGSDITPYLESALSVAPSEGSPIDNLDPQELRRRSLDSISQFIGATADKAPLLLVVEDLHWIDATTLELLGELVERVRTGRILAIFTFRPEFAPPWSTAPHLTVHTLNNLTGKDCRSIISETAGGRRLAEEVIAEILTKTDGVPLFVEELTKAVLESGLLDVSASQASSSGTVSVRDLIPSSLHDSLIARLDRLGQAKEVAQLGAVLGRTFARDLLAAVSEAKPSDLEHALNVIVKAGLVFRRLSSLGEHYEFKHALVRDVAYDSLLRRSREKHHRRVAHVLETKFQTESHEHPEVLAQHYAQGQDFENAVRVWVVSAQRRNESSSHAEALSSVDAAMRALPEMEPGTTRDLAEADLLIERNLALTPTKGYADREAGEAAIAAVEICKRLGHAPTLVWGQRLSALHYSIRGEHEAAVEAATGMLRTAEELGDAVLIAIAKGVLGRRHFNAGELVKARGLFEQSMAEEVHLGAGRSRSLQYHAHCQNLQGLALTYLHLGYLDQAAKTAARQMRQVETWGNLSLLSNALYTESAVRMGRWEFSEAEKVARRMLSHASEHGFRYLRALGKGHLGWAVGEQGDHEQGIILLRESLDAHEAIGSKMAVADIRARLAMFLAGAGAITEAQALLDALSPSSETPWQVHMRGEIAQASGNSSVAVSHFITAMNLARAQSSKTLELIAAMSLASVWCEEGKRADVRDLLGPICAWFTEGLDTPLVGRARELLEAGT